jgi:hypothetical protein
MIKLGVVLCGMYMCLCVCLCVCVRVCVGGQYVYICMYVDDTHVLINARIYVGMQAHEISEEPMRR